MGGKAPCARLWLPKDSLLNNVLTLTSRCGKWERGARFGDPGKKIGAALTTPLEMHPMTVVLSSSYEAVFSLPVKRHSKNKRRACCLP